MSSSFEESSYPMEVGNSPDNLLDDRTIEVVRRKIKPLKIDKREKAAARVDRTLEAATREANLDDTTFVFIALDTIP
ncbi:hypothetical protein WN943_024771 [Citrus x changshan-huyou]